jgi:hypothetical protein
MDGSSSNLFFIDAHCGVMSASDCHESGVSKFNLGTRGQTAAILLLILTTTSLFAGDITTRNGATYHSATVTGVDPDGIRVTHSTGVAKLRFEDLPEALQKQYHYDPSKVAAYRSQLESARRTAAAAEQQRQRQAQEVQAERQRQIVQVQDLARHKAEEQRKIDQERVAAAERQKALERMGRMTAIGIGVFWALLFYFAPSIIARHKANAAAIFIFNLFLGWTFLGWVLALVWAYTKDSAMDTLARERMEEREARYLN